MFKTWTTYNKVRSGKVDGLYMRYGEVILIVGNRGEIVGRNKWVSLQIHMRPFLERRWTINVERPVHPFAIEYTVTRLVNGDGFFFTRTERSAAVGGFCQAPNGHKRWKKDPLARPPVAHPESHPQQRSGT